MYLKATRRTSLASLNIYWHKRGGVSRVPRAAISDFAVSLRAVISLVLLCSLLKRQHCGGSSCSNSAPETVPGRVNSLLASIFAGNI